MTDSKLPAPLVPPPSSIQGRPTQPVAPAQPVAPPRATSAVPPARTMAGTVNPRSMSPTPMPVNRALPSNTPVPGLAPSPAQSSLPTRSAQAVPMAATRSLPPAPVTQNRPPGAPAGFSPPTAGSALPRPPSPVGTPPVGSAVPPKAAIRQSPFRFLPFVLAALLIIGLAVFIFHFFFGNKTVPVASIGTTTGSTSQSGGSVVTLNYWGLWEPSPVLQQVLSDFEAAHPGIKVNYQMQSYQDYRDRLQSAIAAGTGPDVFRFHATWTPMLANELSPMPATVYSPTDFQSIFYPAATQLLTLNGNIMGIPLMYDGLGLYYNIDAFKAANLDPPKTWADLKTDASKLTIRSGNSIQRAGLAIGNSTNVDHFSDILALLILQNGGSPMNPTSQFATDALTFYTNFIKTDQVWNDSFPNSTTAFASGSVAMMFGPSWRVHDIKNMNPNLNFAIVPVPQLTSNKITWATFWAEGVSSQSPHKTEAWELLQYLSSPDVLQKLFSDESQDRAFGELYPRKDMASQLANNQYINPYLSDAPYAQGWYMSSATHDNGLNDQIIKYYQDAITAVLTGNVTPAQALSTVQAGQSQVLRQYNVPGAPAAPQVVAPVTQ